MESTVLLNVRYKGGRKLEQKYSLSPFCLMLHFPEYINLFGTLMTIKDILKSINSIKWWNY